MQVFDSFDIREKFENPVLTIGNYDGIHLGHRRIIERVKERARELSGTSILMTFRPHPLHVLRPDKELAAITPFEEKKRLIRDAGIDVLLVVPFTAEFARIEPEAFVASILLDKLAIKGLVIGYDFRFGHLGKGDVAFLREAGRDRDFFVEAVDAISLDGEKVGSNRIRGLVSAGDVAKAGKFLGRYFAIEGTVIRARGRGKEIGYPTINLKTDYSLMPKNGVYVTEAEFDGRRWSAVTNIGYNPTFEQGQVRSIETFILDFVGDLYDKKVRLHFLERIRDEMKFGSAGELTARIAKDVEIGRACFRQRGK
jgi:riboflavin kinase/FMN adenylyltransferase